MKRITVQVGTEDIERGVSRDPWKCPVSNAMFRLTGQRYCVYPSSMYPLGMKRAQTLLPSEATRWIVHYDRTRLGRPFSFEVDLAEVQP